MKAKTATMARRFELIVFDWDGTLMDSTSAIVGSIQAAARDLGIPPPSDERAHHIIGLGLIDALRHALPDLPAQRYHELSVRYRHHYLSRSQDLVLFAGVAELIDELREAGHFLAVATGKTRQGLVHAFELSGLGPRFHGSRCADECRSKPDPQMLEELMAEFGVSSETTLMIGDTTHDLSMARNAGVAALGVSYGAHPRAALEAQAPLYCAANVSQLTAWLREQA
jgi:phosphoglycolate phosphatase